MKTRYVVLAIVLAGIIAAFAAVGYMAYRDEKAGETAVLIEKIAALDQRISIALVEIDQLGQAEDEAKAQAKALHSELVKKIENIKVTIPQQAQTMPMPEAVKTTQEIIGDPGVKVVEGGVEFTPGAFRLNLSVLMQSSQLSLALKDSMGETAKVQISLARADEQIVWYKAVLKDTNEKHELELNKVEAQVKQAKRDNWKWGLGGALLITLVHFIFGGN